jgi:hypothetical protein
VGSIEAVLANLVNWEPVLRNRLIQQLTVGKGSASGRLPSHFITNITDGGMAWWRDEEKIAEGRR